MPEVSAYTWPDDLPEGCPPRNAREASGTFYRLVRRNPPTADDFVRSIDVPGGWKRNNAANCDSYSVSVYADEADVQKLRALIPPMRKKLVARGSLSPEMGVIKRTPYPEQGTILESHHDWWVPTTYTDVPEFEVVTL